MDILKEQLVNAFTTDKNIAEDKWKLEIKERPINHHEPELANWPPDIAKPKKLESITEANLDDFHSAIAQAWTETAKTQPQLRVGGIDRWVFEDKNLLYAVAKRLWEEESAQYRVIKDENIQAFTERVVITYSEIYWFYHSKQQSIPGMSLRGTYQELDNIAWDFGKGRYSEIKQSDGSLDPAWINKVSKNTSRMSTELFTAHYGHVHNRKVGTFVEGINNSLFESVPRVTNTSTNNEAEEQHTQTQQNNEPDQTSGEEIPTDAQPPIGETPETTNTLIESVSANNTDSYESALTNATTPKVNKTWHRVNKQNAETPVDEAEIKNRRYKTDNGPAPEPMTPEEKLQAAADSWLEGILTAAAEGGEVGLENKLNEILDEYNRELISLAGSDRSAIYEIPEKVALRKKQIKEKYAHLFGPLNGQVIEEEDDADGDAANKSMYEDVEEGEFTEN